MNTSVLSHFEHKCNITIITKTLKSFTTTARSFIQKFDNYYDLIKLNQVGQMYSTSQFDISSFLNRFVK